MFSFPSLIQHISGSDRPRLLWSYTFLFFFLFLSKPFDTEGGRKDDDSPGHTIIIQRRPTTQEPELIPVPVPVPYDPSSLFGGGMGSSPFAFEDFFRRMSPPDQTEGGQIPSDLEGGRGTEIPSSIIKRISAFLNASSSSTHGLPHSLPPTFLPYPYTSGATTSMYGVLHNPSSPSFPSSSSLDPYWMATLMASAAATTAMAANSISTTTGGVNDHGMRGMTSLTYPCEFPVSFVFFHYLLSFDSLSIDVLLYVFSSVFA